MVCPSSNLHRVPGLLNDLRQDIITKKRNNLERRIVCLVDNNKRRTFFFVVVLFLLFWGEHPEVKRNVDHKENTRKKYYKTFSTEVRVENKGKKGKRELG